MVARSLRILLIENSQSDADAILSEIRQGGYKITAERVETRSAMQKALSRHPWDVILSEYTLPRFKAIDALALLRKSVLEIPLIIVSASIGEEDVVDLLEAGARDFVCKGKWARLIPAITGALEDKGHLSEKQHSREMLRMDAQLARILEHAAQAIIAINENQEIILFNLAAEKMFGYLAGEILERPLDILIPDRVAAIHREHILNFAASATSSRPIEQQQELVAKRKDGSEFPVEIGFSKLEFDGSVIFTATIVDATERKREEQAVRHMQELLQALTENAPEGVALIDRDGHGKLITPAGWRMFGFSRGEGSAIDLAEFVHPEDLPAVFSAISNLVGDPTVRPTLCFRLYQKEGAWLWIEGTFINLLNIKSIEAIAIYFRDITDRKQNELKIKVQLERFEALREVDHLIASTFDLRSSLDKLLGIAIKVLAVDAADVLLLDPVEYALQYRIGAGFHTSAIQNAHVRLGKSLAGKVAMERRMVRIQNLALDDKDPFLSDDLKEEGFEIYTGAPLIVKGKVIGVLETFDRSVTARDQDWFSFFDLLAGQAAIMIEHARLFNELQFTNVELVMAYDKTIEGWSHAVDLRDKDTEGHSRRVAEWTLRLASSIGFADEDLIHIRRGALLHDIGKIGIPDEVLLKPGPLNEEEWGKMRQHPQFAYDMLAPITYLRKAIDIPYCHHERFDGTGYPRGLKGEEIPLAARIFAVVDMWDALTSDRPYRKAWPHEKALAYIRDQAGKQLDPIVVELFLKEIMHLR